MELQNNKFILLGVLISSLFLGSCKKSIEAPQIVNLQTGEIVASYNDSICVPEGDNMRESALLHIYKANNSSDGRAVIICPGGGYTNLDMVFEGVEWGGWFQRKGITAIVLEYRLATEGVTKPFEDIEAAYNYLEKHAEELKISPEKIGVIGFSAGGHLAAYASTQLVKNSINIRPAFCVLYYPLITMDDAYAEKVTRAVLLGDNPSEEDKDRLSLEKHVSSLTPPTLIFVSQDDKMVPVENSLLYADSLRAKGIDVDLNVYPRGRHGWGSKGYFEFANEMGTTLEEWFSNMHLK